MGRIYEGMYKVEITLRDGSKIDTKEMDYDSCEIELYTLSLLPNVASAIIRPSTKRRLFQHLIKMHWER